MDSGGERRGGRVPLSVLSGGRVEAPTIAAPAVVLPPDWLPIVLLAGDAVIAGASVIAGDWLRTTDYVDWGTRVRELGMYAHAVPVVMVAGAIALGINRQYRSWRGSSNVEQLFRLYSGIGLAMLMILSLLALTHTITNYSRLAIQYTAVMSAVAMTVERVVLRELETRLRRCGIGTERVLVVGTCPTSELLIGRMSMFPQFGYTVCGVVDDHLLVGSSFAGVPVVGRPPDLPRLVQELEADKCILAMPGGRRERLVELIRQCERQRIDFRLVPDLLELMSTRASSESVDGLPLIGVRHRRIGSPAWVGKRLIDIAVSAWALAVTSPLMLGIAVAIRLTSPGAPAIVGQEQVGRFRRSFTVYRFRTTRPAPAAEPGPLVALRGDPGMTTHIGSLLRRSGLNHLPQLINVLKGDMSLVGPLAQPLALDERCCVEVPRYRERQQVRPGLIGLAEANDVGARAPIADRTRYDIYYIENWSLRMDFRIIALTAIRRIGYRQAN